MTDGFDDKDDDMVVQIDVLLFFMQFINIKPPKNVLYETVLIINDPYHLLSRLSVTITDTVTQHNCTYLWGLFLLTTRII